MSRFPCGFSVLSCALILAAAVPARPQDAPSEPPACPRWQVGQSWIVTAQVYDQGGLIPGQPAGWREPQSWRFQVKAIESLGDEPYYVVGIAGEGENDCPYSFRVWFRQADLYVGRYEIDQGASQKTERQASRTTQDLLPADGQPFSLSAGSFPTLPIATPVFGAAPPPPRAEAGGIAPGLAGEALAISPTSPAGGKPPVTQELAGAVPAQTVRGMHPALQGVMTGRAAEADCVRVRLSTAPEQSDTQYWSPASPWALYGETVESGVTVRKWWLASTPTATP